MLTLPLHPYQEEPVDRFLERHSLLVAYEMGLGKTPIAIACAEELLGASLISTTLVVVPASLRYQWAEALAKFTDLPTTQIKVRQQTLTVPVPGSCVIVDGTPAKRKKQLRVAAEYVIMSYNTVLSDMRAVKRLHPGLVILDEASAIKTFGSERTLKIKRSLTARYRLALTGTPVENRPEEAFSIMEWVDPNVLGAFDLFEKTYIRRDGHGNVKGHKNLALFNHRLSDAMVRRSRSEPGVREYLPDLDHRKWLVEPDKATQDAYNVIADDLLDELLKVRGQSGFDVSAYYRGEKFGENTALGRVMSRYQALELLLDHPALLVRSAEAYADTLHKGGSKYCHEVWQDGVVSHLQHSVKLDFLAGKVEDILAYQGNKILIFSRYPEMLDIISRRLPDQSVQYHGGMSAASKAEAIAVFTRDPDVRVFLSSHAGAYGTDMFMANYLINFDLPWSSGRNEQINGRHQRASSEFAKVFVRDLIVAGTTEERKLKVLDYKRRIGEAVVDGVVPRNGRIENDLITLTDFLADR